MSTITARSVYRWQVANGKRLAREHRLAPELPPDRFPRWARRVSWATKGLGYLSRRGQRSNA